MYKVKLRRFRVIIVAVNSKNYYNSECVSVALFIQHALRIHHIILSSAACPALQYFSTLSHKRHDFRTKFFL